MSRYTVFALVLFLTLLCLVLGLSTDASFLWGAIVFLALLFVGLSDLIQPRHSLLRNYPILGHLRWAFEGLRPEIRQYLLESDQDAVPFSREKRSVVYQRAKNEMDKRPFGTVLDVYEPGYAWLTHSNSPNELDDTNFRLQIGGPDCSQPYDASIYNISAMSFGALSGNAIRALNEGAKQGQFAHDTGEGSISPYHLQGGDLIWEIGSGYFGCRDSHGNFDTQRFAEQAQRSEVKMIELKLSQGAKPGHGGILPAAKVTPEIAAARGVPLGQDCVSPARHPAFSTPIELMEFIARLRELANGKPVGFKLCIGHQWQFMAIIKAMLETEISPDFIVVDGKEGGTGAGPLEFVNRVGTPLREGLIFTRNALIGSGLRDKIRLAASGKLVTAFDLAWALSLGADWCNSARGFMFAIGCIQAQTCHTNNCPVGVTTQDPLRQRALVVSDKARRVANFHRNTVEALGGVIGAAGLTHPRDLRPHNLFIRCHDGEVRRGDEVFPLPESGELIDGSARSNYAEHWQLASASTFEATTS